MSEAVGGSAGRGDGAASLPARSSSAPSVAVVVPVYKQPQYLKDAVLSVTRQSLRERIRIIIVNDGCPFPTTDRLGQALRDAFPGEVLYLRKPNGGLASARNAGIRFALAAWPSIDAIFPLDADNMLSPTTLEKLWAVLAACPDDVGWVYQDLSCFGQLERLVPMALPFSLYRLTEENYCDAGSLIRRRVFDSGLWYDESMTGPHMGYEDWDLFLSAGLRGFRGAPARDTGFLYRKRGYSMVDDAKKHHEDIAQRMRTKHADRLNHNAVTLLEHAELPRFALIDPHTQQVWLYTSPYDAGTQEGSLSGYLQTLAALVDTDNRIISTALRVPDAPYVPPMTLFGDSQRVSVLGNLRLLPGILYGLQKRLRAADRVTLSLKAASRPYQMELIDDLPGDAEVILFGVRTRTLIDLAGRGHEAVQALAQVDARLTTASLGVALGEAFTRATPSPKASRLADQRGTGVLAAARDSMQPLASVLARRARPEPYDDDQPLYGPPCHAEFAVRQQLGRESVSFPYCVQANGVLRRWLNVFFVVPWVWIGGVDRCVQSLARELRRGNPSYRLHLVITDSGRIEAAPEHLEGFHTITSVASAALDRDDSLREILSAADIIVNAHSYPCYDTFAQLRFKASSKFVAYLHVVEPLDDPRPGGHPYTAVREYGNVIDSFVVVSERLKRVCMNFGTPAEKIIVLPNAPTVSPPSAEAAAGIVRDKLARRYTPETPLKVLFVGRLDRQKGADRLQRLAVHLRELELPVELRIVGKSVLSEQSPSVDGPNVRISGPVYESRQLAEHYSNADVLLLPSRWEGAPLAALEAMAFGNIVLATDVGATREVIEHGKTGMLVDAEQPGHALVAEMGRILGSIVENPTGYDQLRLAACERAMSTCWADSAARLTNLFSALVGQI